MVVGIVVLPEAAEAPAARVAVAAVAAMSVMVVVEVFGRAGVKSRAKACPHLVALEPQCSASLCVQGPVYEHSQTTRSHGLSLASP